MNSQVMPALHVAGLTKRFGARAALQNITFTLPAQAKLAIFGPNGAGKTTLLSLLSTLSRPTQGTFEIFGVDALEHADDIRARLGLISHAPLLYADLSAKENLLFFAKLYGLQDPHARVDEMLELVELSHRKHDTVRGFSRGMTQRLSIARALLHNPDLVFLDEPYSGLDVRATQIFDELLDKVCADKTVVLVSHDIQKGFAGATHALVLSQGKQMAYFAKPAWAAVTPGEVLTDQAQFEAVCSAVLGTQVGGAHE